MKISSIFLAALVMCGTLVPECNAQSAEVVRLCKETFGNVGGAAVAGNIEIETGGSYDYQQKQHGGGPGRGLFQMEGPMLGDYNSFLSSKGVADSAASQIAYAQREVQAGRYIGAGNAKKIRGAFESGDVDLATEAFCNLFERPNPAKSHIDRRKAAARRILQELSRVV